VAQRGGLAALLLADPPKDLRIPRRSLDRSDDPLRSLAKKIAELRHLDHTIALLEWDEETMLPVAGRDQRGEQLATLEGLRHALLSSDHLGDLIEEADAQSRDDPVSRREIALLRRQRRSAIAVPDDLVRQLASAKSQVLGAWEEAREQNDFGNFAVPFSQLLGLVRERAAALSHGGIPYDALLDENEPGLTLARLEPLFNELRERLVPLVREAARTTAWANEILKGRIFETSAQWELYRSILKSIGFNPERGRIDPSTHPFTMLAGASDVRLTGRASETNIAGAILTVMHEGGHALYDQGFATKDGNRLIGDAPSSGLHEGLARLWENHIGRSRSFSEFILPTLRRLFPDAMGGLDADAFWRGMNAVCPGYSRVEADEMSYHLHIVLRHELEVALLSGALPVSDLPTAWNERSNALLGVVPSSPRDGVLQDVHWAVGMFGYFPTYTIGSLYAAQLIAAYMRHRDLSDEILRGNFSGLLEWLTVNVHIKGSHFTTEEIIIQATGTGLDVEPFFAHVESTDRAWNCPSREL
jgi:carboxypeptidase Taq